MFRVYFLNFDYCSQDTFDTLEAAITHGISKGFEFSIIEQGRSVASWSPIGGLRINPTVA